MIKFFLTLVFVALLAAGGYVWWVTRDLPDVHQVLQEGAVHPTVRTTQVFARDGSVILSNGQFKQRNVRLADVSPEFIHALLATEDRRYFQHPGVDPLGIARAIFQNLRNKKMSEGGSTITQQLVRNLFLSNERSLNRKIREAALALQVERELSKEQILEMYVNNVYFGQGAYGIHAASEIFFNKTPSQLSVTEAALLAGMPQAPTRYSPSANPQLALSRRNEVLRNMQEAGYIDAAQRERAQSLGLHVVASTADEAASGDRAPYFNHLVQEQIQKWFDLDEQGFWQSGLRIYTTLNPGAQQLATQAVRSQTAKFGRTARGQEAALMSIEPSTGAIVAYVGGRSWARSQYDRVSLAKRSPGSLFKVFTYTTAIEKGYMPNRAYLDAPVSFGNWTPKNYDGAHHGYMTMARALALSNNIIAVKVMQDVGPDAVISVAQRMGVQSRLDNGLSLTLGGSSVSLYEMTGAFGVLVNKGVRAQPYAIERVLDSKGGVLFEHQPEKQDALEPATADTVVAMLKGVVRFGTGRGADIGRPAAGKTGTSDQNRDAWFIGFTPDIVTGVWVGNDNNTSMPGNMSGGTLPAAIWRAYMSPLLASRPPQEFDLAYSKTITDQDFTTYNPENIASQDVGEAPTDDAMAAGAEGAVGGDGGEVPPDAAGGGESPETSHDAMPDATEPPRYTPSQDDIPVPRYVPGGGSSGSRGAASTQQPVYSGGTGNGFPAALPANPPPAYGHPATNGTIGPNGAMAPPPPRRASRIDPAAPMEIPSGQ